MLQEPWGSAIEEDDEGEVFFMDDEEDTEENVEDDEAEGLGAVLGMDMGDGVAMDMDSASVSSEDDYSFPRMARARLNLTVLSQRYNLYFVAYREQIHVFQPKRAPSILEHPDLILHSRPSKAALMVGGYLDRLRPHQFNHLVIGELGHHEVLLGATDDGDVIAYYTHRIAKHIERCGSKNDRPSSPRRNLTRGIPKAFFHENVGISAWGLAIHKQSRLIAVSTNHHEITVFAFALAEKQRNNEPEEIKRSEDEGWTWLPHDPHITATAHMQTNRSAHRKAAWKLQKHLKSRNRNWRILLSLPSDAENLPNVAFCDDEDGNADKVAAVDIGGVLWMVDIWLIASRVVRVPPFDPLIRPSLQGHHPARGWAVMPLSTAHFKQTESVQEALGTKHKIGPVFKQPGGLLDISQTLAEVLDNSAHTQITRRFQNNTDFRSTGPVSWIDSGDVFGGEPTYNEPPLHQQWHPPPIASSYGYTFFEPTSKIGRPRSISLDYESIEEDCHEFHLAKTMIPYSGQHYTEFTLDDQVKFTSAEQARSRNSLVRWLSVTEARSKNILSNEMVSKLSLIRTNETDVELLTLDPLMPSLACRGIIEQVHIANENPPWDLQFAQRLSMLLHVPELSLVVVGSMCGRVALITLTQPPPGQQPQRAFRVEHILPRMTEDANYKKLRPYCCLLGIAISPIPESRVKGLCLRRNETAPARRWRLILHYMDHTLLMYDISRQGDADMEVIF